MGRYNDFIVFARFFNPYDAEEKNWDYGIIFRINSDQDYFFTIRSFKKWMLNGDNFQMTPQGGDIKNLKTKANEFNDIYLVVKSNIAYLFINNIYIDTLDVTEHNISGYVEVATGLFKGSQIAGRQTHFERFTVWSLDQ